MVWQERRKKWFREVDVIRQVETKMWKANQANIFRETEDIIFLFHLVITGQDKVECDRKKKALNLMPKDMCSN